MKWDYKPRGEKTTCYECCCEIEEEKPPVTRTTQIGIAIAGEILATKTILLDDFYSNIVDIPFNRAIEVENRKYLIKTITRVEVNPL